MRVVAVSGHFDPPHVGHFRMFEEAKKLGDVLVVIVNNERQQKLKGSVPFMPLAERIELIRAIRHVDTVLVAIDNDKTVCSTLAMLRPDIFANGGDRVEGNVPEAEVCETFGIKMVYGVGGGKITSSSKLIYEAAKTLGMVPNAPQAPVPVGEDYPSRRGPAYVITEPCQSHGNAICDCAKWPKASSVQRDIP